MAPDLALVVALIGLGASFLSGFLGIGGGIVFAPALLYLPPLLGVDGLDMRTVAGLTIVQGLAACLFAGLSHGRHGAVSKPLVTVMGPTIMVASLAGGLLSAAMSSRALLAVLAILALAGAAMMLLPRPARDDGVDASNVTFNRPAAAVVALLVGLLGGMTGQGGSFILIPIMLYVLRLPMRVAVGSNLGIVFFACLASFVGKAVTGQIVPHLALALTLAALPGSHLGAIASRRARPAALRSALAAVIGVAALRMWWGVFR